jgi:probable rRNA maturation factor
LALDNVTIHFEDISTFPVSSKQASLWLNQVCRDEGTRLTSLTIVLCDDEYLLDMNRNYLSHDYYTDILTFDTSEAETIEGDLFISIDRVKENASTHQVSFENELHRVMVHGLLHLLGYKDKGGQESKIMTAKENTYLSLLTNL